MALVGLETRPIPELSRFRTHRVVYTHFSLSSTSRVVPSRQTGLFKQTPGASGYLGIWEFPVHQVLIVDTTLLSASAISAQILKADQ